MRRIIIVSVNLLLLAVFGVVLARSISARAPVMGSPPLRMDAAARSHIVADGSRTCNPTWQVVPSPNANGLDNVLTAVAVLSTTDVWAVGYYSDTGRYLTLTEHWDGVQWNIVQSPNPGAYNNILRGVTITAANDAWAVGDYNNSYAHPTRHLLTLHWDGVQWNVVPNPDPGGNYDNSVNSVKALASDDVWAVGFYRYTSFSDLRMHWDGVQWTVVYTSPMPYSVFFNVDGPANNNVWMVGRNGNVYPAQSLIEQWDGANWHIAASPVLTTDNWLNGVGVVAPNDVWAVGAYDFYARHSLVEHWDGSNWSVFLAPDVGELKGISAPSATDAWAVAAGTFLHWDGTAWTPTNDPAGGSLVGIDALSSAGIWAVGTQSQGGVSRTLVEHYTAECVTPTTSPTPTTAATASPTSQIPSSTPTLPASPTITTVPGTTTTPTLIATASPVATATATVTPTSTICSIAFSDVPPGSTFYPFVHCLACLGIVQGYPDGTYRPYSPVTRGQAAKIIANSAGFDEQIPPSRQTFRDVPPGSTFWLYIERIALHGAIIGYPCGSPGEPCPGTYFRPQNTLTRGQAAKVVSITAGYDDPVPPSQQTFRDVAPGSTFWLYIERIAMHGVISGYPDGTFRPQNPVTRGQLAKIAANALLPGCGP